MSAFGDKADLIQGVAKSPLIAKSGHLRRGLEFFEYLFPQLVIFLLGNEFLFEQAVQLFQAFGKRR